VILPFIIRRLTLAYCRQSLPLQVSNGVTVVNPSQQGMEMLMRTYICCNAKSRHL